MTNLRKKKKKSTTTNKHTNNIQSWQCSIPRLDGVPSNLIQGVASLPVVGVGSRWALRSLPTWAILWYVKEAAFETTNGRSYCPDENMKKGNSENCKYYRFAPPFSHHINNVGINVHKSVYFKCLRTRGIVKLTHSFAKSLNSSLCLQQLMRNVK